MVRHRTLVRFEGSMEDGRRVAPRSYTESTKGRLRRRHRHLHPVRRTLHLEGKIELRMMEPMRRGGHETECFRRDWLGARRGHGGHGLRDAGEADVAEP